MSGMLSNFDLLSMLGSDGRGPRIPGVPTSPRAVAAQSTTEPEIGISDQYFVLDSWAKVESSNITNGELKFNTAVQAGTRDGTVGINAALTDIIEMELYKFHLPTVPLLPYLTNDSTDVGGVPQPVPNNQLPRLVINMSTPTRIETIGSAQSMATFGGVLGVLIKEMQAQSTIGYNGSRYHWELDTELSPYLTNIIVSPVLGGEVFQLTEPHRSLDQITIVIQNPDVPIMLMPDVLYNVTARIAMSTLNSQPVIEFYVGDQNHNLLAGDRIFFDSINFTDGESDPLFKGIDKWLNDPKGHLIGLDGATAIDPNYLMLGAIVGSTLRPNPDVSLKDIAYSNNRYTAGTVLRSASRINILIAKNRIRLRMRMRKLVGHRTNLKEP